ncbi:hypothetical protein RB195_021830 [Necator americanus]|uniref:Uncharacterized protein n=1 Tax=Necator americanus TaxID=51031 RepID=A0ABR1ED29_NECAM
MATAIILKVLLLLLPITAEGAADVLFKEWPPRKCEKKENRTVTLLRKDVYKTFMDKFNGKYYVALAIMDRVYSSATLDCLNRGEGPIAQDVVVTIHDRDVTLSTEQCEAIAMGVGGFPITAIHAAFRTGKTVAGAITAA